MSSISSRPNMNSRAAPLQSHRSRIRLRGPQCLNRDGVVESADQAAQCRVGHRFIPVIEGCVERSLALDGADDGAEDSGHPQQRGEASAEANAAECGKTSQNDDSQAEPNDDLGRPQFSG